MPAWEYHVQVEAKTLWRGTAAKDEIAKPRNIALSTAAVWPYGSQGDISLLVACPWPWWVSLLVTCQSCTGGWNTVETVEKKIRWSLMVDGWRNLTWQLLATIVDYSGSLQQWNSLQRRKKHLHKTNWYQLLAKNIASTLVILVIAWIPNSFERI